jgi:hypothetical protein
LHTAGKPNEMVVSWIVAPDEAPVVIRPGPYLRREACQLAVF